MSRYCKCSVTLPQGAMVWSAVVVLPGPEVIKLFSCSTQLSIAFQLLIKPEMLKNKDFSCFQTLIFCIYDAYKCSNAINCWHFNIYEHNEFYSQLS